MTVGQGLLPVSDRGQDPLAAAAAPRHPRSANAGRETRRGHSHHLLEQQLHGCKNTPPLPESEFGSAMHALPFRLARTHSSHGRAALHCARASSASPGDSATSGPALQNERRENVPQNRSPFLVRLVRDLQIMAYGMFTNMSLYHLPSLLVTTRSLLNGFSVSFTCSMSIGQALHNPHTRTDTSAKVISHLSNFVASNQSEAEFRSNPNHLLTRQGETLDIPETAGCYF